MRLLATSLLLLTAFIISAFAEGREPGQPLVNERRALMKSISADFTAIGQALRADGNPVTYALPYVRSIEAKAALIPDLFPEGTGKESGLKTRANALIWKDFEKFTRDAAALGSAMAGLAGIIESSGRIVALERFRKLGRETCGNCHTVGSPGRGKQ